MEKIKEVLKNDIGLILKQLADTRNALIHDMRDDFKAYRNIVNMLVKTCKELEKLNQCSPHKNDVETHSYILTLLILESEELQAVKINYIDDPIRFSCLNDAYLELIDRINEMDYKSKNKLHSGVVTLKVTIPKLTTEEEIGNYYRLIKETLPDDVKVIVE